MQVKKLTLVSQGVYDPAKMTVEIPANFHGQQYIVLSTNKNITDDSTVAGPAVIDLAGVPAEPFPYTS